MKQLKDCKRKELRCIDCPLRIFGCTAVQHSIFHVCEEVEKWGRDMTLDEILDERINAIFNSKLTRRSYYQMINYRSNGSPLANLRCMLGYSQKQLARLCKVSTSSIRSWEQGSRNLADASASAIYRLSEKLQISQSMLIFSMQRWYEKKRNK